MKPAAGDKQQQQQQKQEQQLMSLAERGVPPLLNKTRHKVSGLQVYTRPAWLIFSPSSSLYYLYAYYYYCLTVNYCSSTPFGALVSYWSLQSSCQGYKETRCRRIARSEQGQDCKRLQQLCRYPLTFQLTSIPFHSRNDIPDSSFWRRWEGSFRMVPGSQLHWRHEQHVQESQRYVSLLYQEIPYLSHLQ